MEVLAVDPYLHLKQRCQLTRELGAECHAFFSGAATLDPGLWTAWLGKRSKSASDVIKLYGIPGSETVRPH